MKQQAEWYITGASVGHFYVSKAGGSWVPSVFLHRDHVCLTVFGVTIGWLSSQARQGRPLVAIHAFGRKLV